MELADTTINTKGYESLLNLVNNTSNDSFDLYYGLFMYNKNATQELNRLELAFSQVKAQLFDRLHTLIRDDIFDTDGSSPEQLKEAWEKAGESMNERGYKERLIDQVNSTGVIGGSRVGARMCSTCDALKKPKSPSSPFRIACILTNGWQR